MRKVHLFEAGGDYVQMLATLIVHVTYPKSRQHALLVFDRKSSYLTPPNTFHSPCISHRSVADRNRSQADPRKNRDRTRLLFLGPRTDLENNRTDL